MRLMTRRGRDEDGTRDAPDRRAHDGPAGADGHSDRHRSGGRDAERHTACSATRRCSAAEAGIDNYLSKLVDDNQYYLHDVAAGESTRKTGATTVSSSCSATPTPATWTGGATWTYPNGKDAWCPLGNGYEFNLQITGASASSPVVDIVATGRKAGSTSNYRILEEQVRPSSVADFQMLANADISYGSTASTYGKIYAGIDSSGVKHSINHQGTAYGNLYAEGSITGNPTLAGMPPSRRIPSRRSTRSRTFDR